MIETLLKSLERYAATSFKLYKLYFIDFIANLIAELYARLVIIVLLALCVLFFSIGLSLWIGTLIGKAYYGFLIVSGMYFVITLFIISFKKYLINDPIYNSIVRKIKKN